jgi:hypothetical protein
MAIRHATNSQEGLIKETLDFFEEIPVNVDVKTKLINEIVKLKSVSPGDQVDISPWFNLFQI